MKLLIISDIHGIHTNLEKIRKVFQEQKCDRLVVLGDLYYIGPRNSMIPGYDIDSVRSFLNSFADRIICIQGNCDSDVDRMVSDFPIIPEIDYLPIDGLDLYFTHGHIFNQEHSRKFPSGSVLIYGHEHIPFIRSENEKYFLNPGSISLPKQDFLPSYFIYNQRCFTCYTIDGQVIDSIQL